MAKAKRRKPKVKTNIVLTLSEKEANALEAFLETTGLECFTSTIYNALQEAGVHGYGFSVDENQFGEPIVVRNK